jgi:hypothetical protein
MDLLASELTIAAFGVALGVWLGQVLLKALFTLIASVTHSRG